MALIALNLVYALGLWLWRVGKFSYFKTRHALVSIIWWFSIPLRVTPLGRDLWRWWLRYRAPSVPVHVDRDGTVRQLDVIYVRVGAEILKAVEVDGETYVLSNQAATPPSSGVDVDEIRTPTGRIETSGTPHRKVLRFYDSEGQLIGNGIRKGSYAVTCWHVLSNAKSVAGANDKMVPLNSDDFNTVTGVDLSSVKLTDSDWSVLGTRSSVIADASWGPIRITAELGSGPVFSLGTSDRVRVGHAFEVVHNASTTPGFSGAPVYNKAGCTGLHTGGHMAGADSYNRFVALGPFVGSGLFDDDDAGSAGEDTIESPQGRGKFFKHVDIDAQEDAANQIQEVIEVRMAGGKKARRRKVLHSKSDQFTTGRWEDAGVPAGVAWADVSSEYSDDVAEADTSGGSAGSKKLIWIKVPPPGGKCSYHACPGKGSGRTGVWTNGQWVHQSCYKLLFSRIQPGSSAKGDVAESVFRPRPEKTSGHTSKLEAITTKQEAARATASTTSQERRVSFAAKANAEDGQQNTQTRKSPKNSRKSVNMDGPSQATTLSGEPSESNSQDSGSGNQLTKGQRKRALQKIRKLQARLGLSEQ